MNKFEIKSCELIEENGKYYISLVGIHEDDKAIRELKIPRIVMPFTKNAVPNIERRSWVEYTPEGGMSRPHISHTIQWGCGEHKFPIEHKDFISYTERIIEEKTTELTIEEIEKKLGYKIKIVGGKK